MREKTVCFQLQNILINIGIAYILNPDEMSRKPFNM